VKCLGLALDLGAGLSVQQQVEAVHNRHTGANADDHHHILHVALPQLLAACPTLGVRLDIRGGNPFVACGAKVDQVPDSGN
jgi:hypothetical protein